MLSEVNRTRDSGNLNSEDVVRNYWKNFNIAHSLSMVDEIWKEVKSSTLKKSWKKLLPEFFENETLDESSSESVIQEATSIARGVGFSDVEEQDLQILVTPAPTTLEIQEIEAILEETCQSLEPFEEQMLAIISLQNVSTIISLIQSAIDNSLALDPIMTRSLAFKQNCEQALEPYRELYIDLTRRAKQKRMTDYFSYGNSSK